MCFFLLLLSRPEPQGCVRTTGRVSNQREEETEGEEAVVGAPYVRVSQERYMCQVLERRSFSAVSSGQPTELLDDVWTMSGRYLNDVLTMSGQFLDGRSTVGGQQHQHALNELNALAAQQGLR